MTRSKTTRKQVWILVGLEAIRAEPKLKSKLMLFGQFIGDWDIVDQTFPNNDRKQVKRTGEVHFGYILGGRAIQDVWASERIYW